MNLETITYNEYKTIVPVKGQHILAQQTENTIIVYQAYSKSIAEYAVKHQQFGGTSFSFNRMTWIKPNFLWMMYRCGWAAKENQEHVLAITISKDFFNEILSKAVYSSFKEIIYESREDWQLQMDNSEVRLQWDPDHDPFGAKQDRKAVQLGVKDKIMKDFSENQIMKITDLTDFVKEQYSILQTKGLTKLMVPKETIYKPADPALCLKLGLA